MVYKIIIFIANLQLNVKRKRKKLLYLNKTIEKRKQIIYFNNCKENSG